MRWPLVWRSTYDRLRAELDAERKRARRRERRHKAPVTSTAAEVLALSPASIEYDLPELVIEAIATRTGGLQTRAGKMMARVALRSLRDGSSAEQVAALMLRGEE